MIEVDNVDVFNIARAIYSTRNALNSWEKSDSDLENDIVGENDLLLANRLFKASLNGDNHAHRKFMRQIFVSMDITAPLYWWKQTDQYRIGVTTNSCSTMHKIAAKEFDINDFSHDYLEELKDDDYNYAWQDWIDRIKCLNYFRDKYNSTKDKRYWRMMIEKLPSSYNQRRTLTMNYEVAYTIIAQRTGHKLDEWNEFVDVLKSLPYMMEIISND